MKKVVKSIGSSSLGIIFDMEDRKIYGIEKGDVLDLEICKSAQQIINEVKRDEAGEKALYG